MLIVSGSSARMASGMKDCPVDAAIVGIVDTVEDHATRLHAARPRHRRRRRDPQGRNLDGIKLLVLQPMTPTREPAGRPLVAVDSVGAGVGEDVFFVRGKEASFPFYPAEAPVDAGIVGIVDHWDVGVRTDADPDRSTSGAVLNSQSMQIARVVGTVVATQKHRKFEGAKLLLVQPLNLDDTPRGTALLAVDGVGAGVHEKVLVVLEGRAAGEALGRKAAPVDAAIIGIIDQVDVDG